MVGHALHPGTLVAEAGASLSLRPGLVYKVRYWTARVTQRHCVLRERGGEKGLRVEVVNSQMKLTAS